MGLWRIPNPEPREYRIANHESLLPAPLRYDPNHTVRGDVAVPPVLRALDAAGLHVTAISVARPSLDDVFLTLTGRSLRDNEEGAA